MTLSTFAILGRPAPKRATTAILMIMPELNACAMVSNLANRLIRTRASSIAWQGLAFFTKIAKKKKKKTIMSGLLKERVL